MKKNNGLIILSAVIFFALVLSGCTRGLDELREENESLNKVIDDMNDEINSLKDKASDLVSDAEENWKLLQECIDEKQENIENTVIITPSKDKYDVDSMTLLDSSSHDITGDGIDDKISLYTSAGKDQEGRIMWDDGQFFLLIFNDGEKDYGLFNERVQIGRVYYSIFDGDDSGLFVMVATYAGVNFMKFTYGDRKRTSKDFE